jgi:hypothetical protein
VKNVADHGIPNNRIANEAGDPEAAGIYPDKPRVVAPEN